MSERMSALVGQCIFNSGAHCREEVSSLGAQNLSVLLCIFVASSEI